MRRRLVLFTCFYFCLSAGFYVGPGYAGEYARVEINLTIPEIDVDPYFKPYVAVWVETNEREVVDAIALWYQLASDNTKQEDGKKWLKDLRQWWRKIGRNNTVNYDAVTGATKRPRRYQLNWSLSSERWQQFNSKPLVLHIEAAREEGGRSYKRIPLSVEKITSQISSTMTIPADGELGEINVILIKNSQEKK